MDCYRINFLDEFHCQAGDCRLTCCKGWQVPVDEETRMRYLSWPMKQRLQMWCELSKKDDTYIFRYHKSGCRFWTREGLCRFQKDGQEEAMPLVCQVFPRKQNSYGVFMEESLYLSCPYAAKLFLQNRKKLGYCKTTGTLRFGSETTNDDTEFLNRLLAIRTDLIQMLEQTQDLDTYFGVLLGYATQAQLACVKNEPLPSIYNIEAEALIWDGLTTDRFLTGGFYHPRLKKNSPDLYRLLICYFREMENLTIGEAGIRQNEIRQFFYRNNPEYQDLARHYYKYYLLTSFLDIYDSYSFHRVLSEGMVHTHLLELFLGLSCINQEKEDGRVELTDDEIAQVIAVYERRGRHNQPILDNYYEVLQDAIVKKA